MMGRIVEDMVKEWNSEREEGTTLENGSGDSACWRGWRQWTYGKWNI